MYTTCRNLFMTMQITAEKHDNILYVVFSPTSSSYINGIWIHLYTISVHGMPSSMSLLQHCQCLCLCIYPQQWHRKLWGDNILEGQLDWKSCVQLLNWCVLLYLSKLLHVPGDRNRDGTDKIVDNFEEPLSQAWHPDHVSFSLTSGFLKQSNSTAQSILALIMSKTDHYVSRGQYCYYFKICTLGWEVKSKGGC